MDELGRLNDFAQSNGLPLVVRDLDADGGFAGNTLDENGFRLQGEAEVFGEADDAAVLDTCFRLELKRSDHRAGIDLRDAALHIEFEALRFDSPRALLQLFLVEFVAALTFAQ